MMRRPVLGMSLAASLAIGLASSASAQVDLRDASREMAEQVRRLAGEIEEHVAQIPNGRQLLEDARELRLAVGDFRDSLEDRRDAYRTRQAYSGIDVSWQHLRGQLSQQPVIWRDIANAAGRVDAADRQLHRALGLNDLPPNFYGAAAPAPPTGVADVRRLAHALVSRAQQLAAVIPLDMGNNPDAGVLTQAANDLATSADQFHDALDSGQAPEAVRASYNTVSVTIDRLAPSLSAGPPRVQQSWQALAVVDNQIRQNLGLAVQPVAPPVAVVTPGVEVGPSPVAALADQLVAQVDNFIAGFAPIANATPENPIILSDAERLRGEADRFRRHVARGVDTTRLAYEYRDVDATWQRMWRRIERVSRGGNGPNVQRAREIGPICAQLHQMLAMPGYSPSYLPDRR